MKTSTSTSKFSLRIDNYTNAEGVTKQWAMIRFDNKDFRKVLLSPDHCQCILDNIEVVRQFAATKVAYVPKAKAPATNGSNPVFMIEGKPFTIVMVNGSPTAVPVQVQHAAANGKSAAAAAFIPPAALNTEDMTAEAYAASLNVTQPAAAAVPAGDDMAAAIAAIKAKFAKK